MTMSEKMALDAIDSLDFDLDNKKLLVNNIGFILTVAMHNDNWDLVNDLLDKGLVYIRGK